MYNVQSHSTARKRYHFTQPLPPNQALLSPCFVLLCSLCKTADEGSSRRLGHRMWGQRPSRAYSSLSPSRSSPRLISQRKDTEQTHVTHTHANSVALAKTHTQSPRETIRDKGRTASMQESCSQESPRKPKWQPVLSLPHRAYSVSTAMYDHWNRFPMGTRTPFWVRHDINHFSSPKKTVSALAEVSRWQSSRPGPLSLLILIC